MSDEQLRERFEKWLRATFPGSHNGTTRYGRGDMLWAFKAGVAHSATVSLNARRYEWLRSHDKYEYPAMLGFAQVLIFQPTDEFLTDQYKRLSGVALDEAIDAQLNTSDRKVSDG